MGVTAFGRKFRGLICCERKRKAEDEDEDGAETMGDVDVSTPKGRKTKLNKKDRKGSKATGLIQAQQEPNLVGQQPIGLYPQGNQPIPAPQNPVQFQPQGYP